MIGQLREPQRLGVADQLAQDAVPGRQPADRRVLFGADADGEELREPGAVTDHAQRAVLRVDDDHRRLDDAAQYLRQLQPLADRQHGFEEQMGRRAGTLLHGVEAFLQVCRQGVQPPPSHAVPFGAAVVGHTASTVARGEQGTGHISHGRRHGRSGTSEQPPRALPGPWASRARCRAGRPLPAAPACAHAGGRKAVSAMQLPLVVGVDGSAPALRALDWAVDEAALHGVPLRLVFASKWERYEGVAPAGSPERPAEEIFADNVVGAAAEHAHLRNADVPVSVQVLAEDTVTALLQEGRYASALILGSKGRGEFADLLLGSVSLAVSARARCPVVVVRGDKAALARSHGRILLGVGDPAKAAEAVRYAFREAEARGCALDAVRFWRCPAHEDHRPPDCSPTTPSATTTSRRRSCSTRRWTSSSRCTRRCICAGSPPRGRPTNCWCGAPPRRTC